MLLPATIDPERLDDVTDEELIVALVACGFDRSAARFVVEVLRGREAVD